MCHFRTGSCTTVCLDAARESGKTRPSISIRKLLTKGCASPQNVSSMEKHNSRVADKHLRIAFGLVSQPRGVQINVSENVNR